MSDLFDEGDKVLLKATVFRANAEQAFIEFMSMDGTFSVRVPTHELTLAPFVDPYCPEHGSKATTYDRCSCEVRKHMN